MLANDATLISQLGDIVRKGATEAASGIYNPTIQNMLPMAMHRWAASVAEQPARRGLLQREFRVAIVSGAGILNETDHKLMLKGSLRYSYGICDNDQAALTTATDAEEIADAQPVDFPGTPGSRAVFHLNYFDLQSGQYLDPSFDHYALRDRFLLVTTQGNNLYTGTFKLFANYIPDFSSTYPIPEELRDSFMASVAAYMQTTQAGQTAQQPPVVQQ